MYMRHFQLPYSSIEIKLSSTTLQSSQSHERRSEAKAQRTGKRPYKMMKLSRPVHAATLAVLLVVACHLSQLSDCARPSSPTPRREAAAFPSAHGHDAVDAVEAHQPTTEAVAGGHAVGRTNDDGAGRRGAPPSDSDATPVRVRGEQEGVGSSGPWQQQRSGAPRTVALLRSTLPRRFLAVAAGVEESDTDGAGASCHSHDPHVNCPPSKR